MQSRAAVDPLLLPQDAPRVLPYELRLRQETLNLKGAWLSQLMNDIYQLNSEIQSNNDDERRRKVLHLLLDACYGSCCIFAYGICPNQSNLLQKLCRSLNDVLPDCSLPTTGSSTMQLIFNGSASDPVRTLVDQSDSNQQMQIIGQITTLFVEFNSYINCILTVENFLLKWDLFWTMTAPTVDLAEIKSQSKSIPKPGLFGNCAYPSSIQIDSFKPKLNKS